ncbi:MAG: dodecin domain-containing protein [Planctomycetaceae bacterium]
MRWFEVLETRGHIENGTIAHEQVLVEIGAHPCRLFPVCAAFLFLTLSTMTRGVADAPVTRPAPDSAIPTRPARTPTG